MPAKLPQGFEDAMRRGGYQVQGQPGGSPTGSPKGIFLPFFLFYLFFSFIKVKFKCLILGTTFWVITSIWQFGWFFREFCGTISSSIWQFGWFFGESCSTISARQSLSRTVKLCLRFSSIWGFHSIWGWHSVFTGSADVAPFCASVPWVFSKPYTLFSSRCVITFEFFL